MKRFFCVLLVWALLPLTAWAEDPSAVDIAALMARQVSGNSTFRAQLTAELSEQAPAGADATLWTLLSAAVRDASLESSFIFSRAGETLGNSQTTLTLKRGEDALSTLRLAGRGDTWQLWGDGTEGKVWQLPRDTGLLLRDRYLTLEGWGASGPPCTAFLPRRSRRTPPGGRKRTVISKSTPTRYPPGCRPIPPCPCAGPGVS